MRRKLHFGDDLTSKEVRPTAASVLFEHFTGTEWALPKAKASCRANSGVICIGLRLINHSVETTKVSKYSE